MAAYFETGFTVRQPAWHGEGLVLDDYPTDWVDAREKAGLLWEPSIRALYEAVGDVPVCTVCTVELGHLHQLSCSLNETGSRRVEAHQATLDFREVKGYKRVVRDDTKATLGVVGDQFSLVSHEAMGGIIEAILEVEPGKVKFETAGSCKGGAQVWALAYLDEPYTVEGDNTEHLPFLALLNSHDGTGACKVTLTQVRVVCWNTFQQASAEGERTGRQFSIRHVGNVDERIEQAKAALKGLRSEVDDYKELAAELINLRVEADDVSRFIHDFLPSPEDSGVVISDRVRDNVDRARNKFRSLYFDSVTTETIRGTGFGLFQAGTEYLDHARGYRSTDSYVGRSILRAEPAKAKLLTLVRANSN